MGLKTVFVLFRSLVGWVRGAAWCLGQAVLDAMVWEWGCENSPSLSV